VAQPAGRPALRRLVERMRADPGMIDGAVAAARARSPAVAALPVQEVRRHTLNLVTAIAAVVVDGAGTDDFGRAAEHLAADRAVQGVPLTALLDGYQAARRHLVERSVTVARGAGIATDELLDGLLELDRFTAGLQERMVRAYREAELGLARGARGARIEALRDLLHDGPPERVADAGLRPGRAYHCWVADVTDPGRSRAGGPDGVSGMVDGYLCGVAARLPDRAWLGDVLVVTAPAVPPSDLAGSYRLCAAALASARARGLAGPRSLASLAVAVAVDAQPDAGAVLASEHLGRLDPTDGFHRLLAATALAYLEHGSRTDLAAVALHVHPNTVKHRLHRLAELTDFDTPAAPDEALARAVRWWWALRVWLGR
jgi:hypothetical protein